MSSGSKTLPFKWLKGPLDTKISRLGEFTQLQLQNVITFQSPIAYTLEAKSKPRLGRSINLFRGNSI